MKRLSVLILILMVAFAFACAKKKEAGSEVLAKINTKTITKQDFIKKLNSLPEWARGRFTSQEGKRQFLDEIIKEEILYQEALKTGLDKDEDFRSKMEEFKRMTLLSTLLKKEVEEKVKVDENEVKDFYEKHKDTFNIGEEVTAKHILVDTIEEAQDIQRRILVNKEDFSKLAKSVSKDHASAENGGDLGTFSRGRMVPEFENAAFSLKPGEISEPVKTSFGYHIIQVVGRKKGKERSFDEVEDIIERQLTVEKQKNIFETYIKNLKEKSAKVEIREEGLKKFMEEKIPGADDQPVSPHG